jgi:RNA 2',3'-cyclic 3'-phosphodiesterase
VTPRILRTFVAFPVAEEVRAALGREARRLADGVPGLRPVRPEAIHLTLHFLGPTPEGDVPAILDAIGRAAEGRTAVPVRYEGLGAFPSPARPRVLWAGVVEPEAAGALAALAGAALRPLGHGGEDRDYHPHLTLARAGSARLRALGPLLRPPGGQPAAFGGDVLSDLRLMVSEPSPAGSKYRSLGAVPLPLRTDR